MDEKDEMVGFFGFDIKFEDWVKRAEDIAEATQIALRGSTKRNQSRIAGCRNLIEIQRQGETPPFLLSFDQPLIVGAILATGGMGESSMMNREGHTGRLPMPLA